MPAAGAVPESWAQGPTQDSPRRIWVVPPCPLHPAAPARWPWSGKGTWDARPGLHGRQEHCGQPTDCLHWLSLPAGLPWGTGTPTSASDGLKQGTLRRIHLVGFVSAEERKKGLPPSSEHFWKKGMSQCTGPADGGRSGQTPDRSAQAGLGNWTSPPGLLPMVPSPPVSPDHPHSLFHKSQ